MFRLDTMHAIASLLDDHIKPGESISIAKSVLKNAYPDDLKPGMTLGDILISHIPKGYKDWTVYYNSEADCFQFKRHKSINSPKL